MEKTRNFERVCEVFRMEASRLSLRGVLGVSAFEPVYSALLDIQKDRLKRLCGPSFSALREEGSFISIAYAYPAQSIDSIAIRKGTGFDKERWNVYARWYTRLNNVLDATADRLAQETEGTAIPATITGNAIDVDHVEEYYGMVVSHRVVAEQAGIGWRGRNELVVNPRYSCTIRLASVATPLPLERTATEYEGCGECRSCLDACTVLRQKEILEDYRENCRRYMLDLGLDYLVCGMCIKSCANSPLFKPGIEIKTRPSRTPIYYT
jgi:epoxyqueuosine reductase QueG